MIQSLIFSTSMKPAVIIISLSVAVLIVLTAQVIRQELKLRNLKFRAAENTAGIKQREDGIAELKTKVQTLKETMTSVNNKLDGLKKKKETMEKSTKESDTSLQTCKSEKADAEKKKADITEAITKIKADHEQAKKKAGEDVQGLKQRILDRDKAVCAFVDTTNEEARKVCGITEAPK
uniref:Uncharacterized protein n=1 Tax=Monopterus albus TaxID=43700 RepID=A0A3Q3IKW4_MONAL